MLRLKILVSAVPLIAAAILARVELVPSQRPCIAIGTDIGSRDPTDYLDLGIVETLKRDGYFAQLEKTYPMRP